MWSGRFREPLDATFESWQRSFPFDWRLVPYEVEASIAHARAIEAAGILTSEELLLMIQGLRAVAKQQAEQGEAIVAANPQAEDVHHYVELELTKQIGDLALKLHTGRSRNEQIATDMRLFVREAIDNTLEGLAAWRKALIDLADSAGEAVMPSYTHLQRAEPVLVAHWLLAYVSMLERDSSRLTDCRKRMNLCPLGSGAVAGATLALDRTIAASALGFDAPTPNSMDATSDRDFALEFTQALSTLGIHISRFAEELTLYSTAEFGFLDLPEAFSTGSSAMPQKKNPDLTELIRGKSGRLLGAAVTLSTLIKGLPLAYNKDLQEGQEPVFDAADTIDGILRVLPDFTRRCASVSTGCRPPRRPAISMRWLRRLISRTRAFPSARPTRRSATPSAWALRPGANCRSSLSTSFAGSGRSSGRTSSTRSRSRLRWTAMTLSAAQRGLG